MVKIPDSKTAANVQKNIIGYALIALGGAVVFLFTLFINLNSYIREDLAKSNADMRLLIYKNNLVLQDIKIIFVSNQETLKRQTIANKQQAGEIAAQNFIKNLERELEDK